MPVDPAHGRRIPSGRRAGRVLAGLLRAMKPRAAAAVRQGRVPDLRAFVPEVARELLPIVYHEYTLGRHQVQRQVRNGLVGVGEVVRRGGAGGLLAVRGGAAVHRRADVALRTKAPAPPPGLSLDFGLLRVEVPAAVQRLVLDLAGSITDTIRDGIRDELAAGLRAGEGVADIAGRLDDLFSPKRAYLIAATEASRSMHAGEADAAREMGAAGLEWLASSDACDVCQGLAGKRVRFGEPFHTHATGAAAYRQVMHPPLHPNCACSTRAWWAEDERRVGR